MIRWLRPDPEGEVAELLLYCAALLLLRWLGM
jgi:hypothetical protein